jgi:hypothetical protein
VCTNTAINTVIHTMEPMINRRKVRELLKSITQHHGCEMSGLELNSLN